MKKDKAYNRYKEIFKTHSQLEKNDHVKKLIELDTFYPVDSTFFCIVNTSTQSFEYISKNFKACTGLNPQPMLEGGIEYFVKQFHPKDVELWLRALNELMEFTMHSLPSNIQKSRMNYTWNYRIKNGNGEYVNVIQNATPLQFDKNNKPIIGISHYTVMDTIMNMDVCASAKYLNDKMEYETLFFKNLTSEFLLDGTSKREKDIIRLLLLKKSAKQIAKNLSISHHTVNTHRRNILQKMDLKSTGELIGYFKNNPGFL